MDKRVNITYSVDIEEMPSEVMHLVEKGCAHLHKSNETLRWLTEDNILSSVALTQIDVIRRSLAKIDMALLDASNIVKGYLDYQESPPTPPIAEQDTVESPPPGLESLIEEFRNSLGEIDEVASSHSS